MVTKRLRSEYMKRFKDPKWETYSKCYEEMLRYRLTRRLLEQTHNPWFWNGEDTDSEPGNSPAPPAVDKNQVQPTAVVRNGGSHGLKGTEHVKKEETTQEGSLGAQEVHVPEGGARVEEQNLHSPAPNGDGVMEVTRETERDAVKPVPSQQPKLPRRTPRVRPAPLRNPVEVKKENRHPFALYGAGERQADMAARKTHNVGPVQSTNEIHVSALRAKTRREVERQLQTEQVDRRRSKSADQEKSSRAKGVPEFNPWVTEYMRCFSARSR
ncbi:centriole, cilia and spindle-associated protein [Aplochiton taeniatus]